MIEKAKAADFNFVSDVFKELMRPGDAEFPADWPAAVSELDVGQFIGKVAVGDF